jgi:hypothetical protein
MEDFWLTALLVLLTVFIIDAIRASHTDEKPQKPLEDGTSSDMNADNDTVAFSSPRRLAQVLFLTFVGSIVLQNMIEHPRLNAPLILGAAIATTLLALFGGMVIVFVGMLFTEWRLETNRSKFQSFCSALTVPVIISSAIFLFKQFNSVSKDAEDAREFQRMRAEMKFRD